MSDRCRSTLAHWRDPPAGRLGPALAAVLAALILCNPSPGYSQEPLMEPQAEEGLPEAFRRPAKEDVDAAVLQLFLLLAVVVIGGILFLAGYWYYYVPTTDTTFRKEHKRDTGKHPPPAQTKRAPPKNDPVLDDSYDW